MKYFFVLYFYSTLHCVEQRDIIVKKGKKNITFFGVKGTLVVNFLPLTSFLPSTLLLYIIHRWTNVTDLLVFLVLKWPFST